MCLGRHGLCVYSEVGSGSMITNAEPEHYMEPDIFALK